MKTIETVRQYVLTFAPWVIGLTIFFGCVTVLPNFSYNYVNSKSIIIEIGFALVILLGLLCISWKSVTSFFKSKIVWGITAFIAASLLATFFSIDPTMSWLSHMERGVGMFFLLLVAMGSFVSILLLQETKTFRRAVLVPLSLAGAVIGISTIIGATGLNWGHILVLGDVAHGGGLTGNSSFAGTFLMMTWFITAYLFFTTRKSWKKIVFGILGLVTVLTPVMVNYGMISSGIHSVMDLVGDARGATISVILGSILSLGLYFSFSQKKNIKWIARIISGLVISGTIIAVALVCIPGNKVHNFFGKETEGARFFYWDYAVQSFEAHPILGTGPETYRYADEHYFNPEILRKTYGGEIWSDKPHNAYLEILATTGIVGSLAYLAMLAFVILGIIRLAKKQENKIVVAMFSGLLLAYLLNNFILFDIAGSYLMLFLMFFWIAKEELVMDRVSLGSDNGQVIGPVSFVVRTLVGLVVVSTVLGVVIPELVKMKLVLNEMYAPLDTRAVMYQRSENVSSFGSGLSFAERADVYSQNYQNNIAAILKTSPASQKLVLADIDALIAQLAVSMKKYPISTQGLTALGRLASLRIAISNTVDETSVAQMTLAGKTILQLSPNNMQGYWFLGQVAIYNNDYKTALGLFNKAIAIDPHVPESHLAVLNLAQLIGDKTLYNQALKNYQDNVIPEDRK